MLAQLDAHILDIGKEDERTESETAATESTPPRRLRTA